MGGQGQLVPAPVATAVVKEESQGKASSPGRESQSAALDSLEQARAVLESAEPGPRLTGKQQVTVGEVKLAPAPLGRPWGRLEKGLAGLVLEGPYPFYLSLPFLGHVPQAWPNLRVDRIFRSLHPGVHRWAPQAKLRV